MDINTDNADTLAGALRLIADIREAAGDPEGRLMQDELVARIHRMHFTISSIAYHTEYLPTATLDQVGKFAAEAIK